jgi:hypothetical protein
LTDPQVGRFITRDWDLGQNPYIYCGADPINRVDPTGGKPTKRFWYWLGIGLIIVGLVVAGPACAPIADAIGTTGPVVEWGGTITGAVGAGVTGYGGDPAGPFFSGGAGTGGSAPTKGGAGRLPVPAPILGPGSSLNGPWSSPGLPFNR